MAEVYTTGNRKAIFKCSSKSKISGLSAKPFWAGRSSTWFKTYDAIIKIPRKSG